jgi:hypothetical protein
MRSSPSIYLDTSFFTGLLENEEGRQIKAKAVLRYERGLSAKFHTSFLTLNEFAVSYYDKYRSQPDCDSRVNEAIASIRNIANTHGIDDDIAKDSARVMSIWGELQSLKPPEEPRYRKHRWDSIHLATANVLKVARAYAFVERVYGSISQDTKYQESVKLFHQQHPRKWIFKKQRIRAVSYEESKSI